MKLLCFLLLTQSVHAKAIACSDEINQWVEDNAPNYNIQGVSLSILLSNGKVCSLSYGYANKEKKLKVHENTRFNAASISKPLSAYVALALFHQYKLNPKASINQYLKHWQLKADAKFQPTQVNLYNLLSHSSGMTGFRCQGYRQNQAFPSILQALDGKKPANTPAVTMITKPNQQFLYSPAAYMIVQQVIEDVANKPFSSVMDEQLLKPLKMTHSSFQQPLPSKYLAEIAMPYLPNGQELKGGPLNFTAAAGGLWTSSQDLIKFIIALQQAYQDKPAAVLKPKITQRLLQAQFSPHWGLGIEVNLDKNGEEVTEGDYFGHGGFNSGYLSFMLGNKKHSKAFVVLLNTAPLMTTKGDVVQYSFIKALNKKIATVYQW